MEIHRENFHPLNGTQAARWPGLSVCNGEEGAGGKDGIWKERGDRDQGKWMQRERRGKREGR